MASNGQQRIVTGVNGSGASQAALRWAAAEASMRHAELHVVHAWDPVQHRAPYASASASSAADQERQAAEGRLDAAMRAVFGPAPPGRVTAELAEGRAERVLVEHSAGADLLVLGATTASDPAARPAGPVVRACLAHARCPVVIISATAVSTAGFSCAAQRSARFGADGARLTAKPVVTALAAGS
jgi:nucleotide-binding universal stress UspA family protein